MNKYRNIKTEVDGILFDSKKEAKRYKELKLLERAGEISSLILQPKYTFPVKYDSGRFIIYKADFQYLDKATHSQIVEDVKGMKTDVYKIKKAMMKHFHNIEVQEI